MKNNRILREQVCIEKMILLYCKGVHQTDDGLCVECRRLFGYARQRLERCIFSQDKPVCAKCPVHCYQKTMRQNIVLVMRYAGPRMLYKHPILALRHLIDSIRSRKRYVAG
ncbi:nitrous oxide-stimulated promoter family protein [Propionispora sp. 2/2-37]|uniref:nitrous oxide-stimulated promoter family protein n=1 Tax=Propionispora sp. 2/2-37 TaxID=1677858 RepID=UPI001C0F4905|nr:nitrous oxide-stimulated promoter family protein [Propionispora sp. 2/2-37]